MAGLGAIYGEIRIDVKQAVAAYALVRAQNARTLYALRGSETGFRNSGLAMTAVGYGLVSVFGKAVTAAAEFERKLDFFGAVSNATAAQMEAVQEEVLQVGKDTIYSAGQIADAVVELGKAGVSAEQIAGGVARAVANLGAAADIPLDQAAIIVTAALQTFKLEAKDTIRVTDLLAGAANASIVEVEDLGVSLKYVGGVAASVSLPVEDVITAISILGKAGIRGSTAGTSLRQILVSLTGTSKKASGVLKDLGIITKDGTNLFFDAQGKAKPLADIFQILQDKTAGLTEAQRLAAFKIIFNNRALAAANILARAGADGFQEMTDEIGKTTAADVAAKRLDNLSGDMEILRGNIETLLIEQGQPFQAFLRVIVQGITKLVQAFGNLPGPVQTVIFALIGISGVLLLVMGVFNLFISTGFAFAANILRLLPALQFLRGVLFAVTGAVRAFTLALLTNPIFLIIAAIVALVVIFVVLFKRSQTFRNIIASIGRFFVSVWNGVLNFFKGVPAFFSRVWDSIKNAFSAAVGFIARNWKTILVVIGGPIIWIIALVKRFGPLIVSFFATMAKKVVQIVSQFVGAVIRWFATLPERIAFWLGFLVGRAIRIWFEMWKFFITKTIQGITAIIRFFASLPGRIIAFVRFLVTAVINYYKWLWTTAINIVRAMITGIINFFKALPGRIIGFIRFLVTSAVNLFKAWWRTAVSIWRSIVSGIINIVRGLPGKIIGFFKGMFTGAKDWLGRMLSTGKDLAGKIVNGIKTAITALPGIISDIFRKVLSAIGGFATGAFNKAKSVASSMWNGFKKGLGIASPSYIERAAFAITDNLDNEAAKSAKAVQQFHTLGKNVFANNPAAYLARSTGASLASLAGSQSLTTLRTLSNTPGAIAGSRASGQTAQGSRTVNRTLHIEINNPVPERASDSLYTTHQKLAYMGLDGRDS